MDSLGIGVNLLEAGCTHASWIDANGHYICTQLDVCMMHRNGWMRHLRAASNSLPSQP